VLTCGAKLAAVLPLCPDECDSCDDGVCTFACRDDDDCKGRTLACPEGMACRVVCSGDHSCAQATIACPELFACDVTCSGEKACEHASTECASGPCSMDCSAGEHHDSGACHGANLDCGSNACRAVSCGGDDGLDVSCGDACACTSCKD
jgi:hypothetical protein